MSDSSSSDPGIETETAVKCESTSQRTNHLSNTENNSTDNSAPSKVSIYLATRRRRQS
jgi:hypothetical protein